MLEPIYIEDLFKVLGDFVRYYPPTQYRCQRPQTFAVLEEFKDLDTSNLMKTVKDKGKPYFYSREWDKNNLNNSDISFNAPILVAFNDTSTVTGLFNNKGAVEASNIEIAYLDKYDRECANNPSETDPCKSRVRNEIYKATLEMLKNLATYLTEVKYYVKDGAKFGLYHPETIIAIGEEGLAFDNNLTRRWVRAINSGANQTVTLEKWDGGIRELYGYFLNISVPFQFCNTFEYEPVQNKIIDKGDQGKK